jgi:hypothetical protein
MAVLLNGCTDSTTLTFHNRHEKTMADAWPAAPGRLYSELTGERPNVASR